MTPAPWSYADLTGDLHTDHEEHVLCRMVDGFGNPKPHYATWTRAEVLAHVRNVADERERAYGHGTGATK